MTEAGKPEVTKTTAEPAAKGSVHGSAVSFSINDSKHDGDNPNAPKKRGSSSVRSSFLTRMGMSFKRSSGDRGADVETLRGTNGADFEGNATIKRGDGSGGCGCRGDPEARKEYLLLIKGPFCFVFKSAESLAPKYAISLSYMKPVARAPSHGRSLVTLETTLGEIEYEMSFADETTAKAFKTAAGRQAARGQAEEVRKRLGHEHLLTKRASVRYAEAVATKKINDAPEKEPAFQDGVLAGGMSLDATPF